MSYLVELSIFPLDKGESVGKYVARVVDLIDKSGLDYRVGPMGTCFEGEWDEVFHLIRECFDNLKTDCQRVTASLKIDWRSESEGRLKSKIGSLEKYLGRTLKH